MFKDYLLTYKCQACKKTSKLNYFNVSRSDMENELGTNFQVSCEHCAIRKSYHVNDITAIPNRNYTFLIILAILGLLVAAIMFLLGKGVISTFSIGIPIAIYLIYRNNTEKAITRFNRNVLPRDRDYQPKNKKIL